VWPKAGRGRFKSTREPRKKALLLFSSVHSDLFSAFRVPKNSCEKTKSLRLRPEYSPDYIKAMV
jgi:hypothetical protein